jgi:hypothetical protein
MAPQRQEAVTSVVAVERLRQGYPAEGESLMAFLRDQDSGGALDERDNELINVALAVQVNEGR